MPDSTHGQIILDLIFYLATWHALAKLRLHSDTSLTALERITSLLGQTMRTFVRRVCAAFDTRELPKETMARHRRAGAAASKAANANATNTSTPRPPQRKVPAKTKKFNLCTYKYHRMADYPRAIRRFGPTDNFTTQTVSDRCSC